jgi:hypothetical protein
VHSKRSIQISFGQAELHGDSEASDDLIGCRTEVVHADHAIRVRLVSDDLEQSDLGVGFVKTVLQRCRLSVVDLHIGVPKLLKRFLLAEPDE